MSDLVKRLRELEAKLPTSSDNWIEARELQLEAAARIEALEAEVEALKPAAGMVALPRAELEWVQQRCNEASPSYSERDILHDIHAKVRDMTEAANG